jgi:hypothetical protein
MHSIDRNGLWNIDRLGSDYIPENAPGCFDPGCSGATGRWVLAGAGAPVPAPTGLYLLGFALIALGALRVKQRR